MHHPRFITGCFCLLIGTASAVQTNHIVGYFLLGFGASLIVGGLGNGKKD